MSSNQTPSLVFEIVYNESNVDENDVSEIRLKPAINFYEWFQSLKREGKLMKSTNNACGEIIYEHNGIRSSSPPS